MTPVIDYFSESWAWVIICLICLLIGSFRRSPLPLHSLGAKKHANPRSHLLIPYTVLM
jgi:hypothetical protein